MAIKIYGDFFAAWVFWKSGIFTMTIVQLGKSLQRCVRSMDLPERLSSTGVVSKGRAAEAAPLFLCKLHNEQMFVAKFILDKK